MKQPTACVTACATGLPATVLVSVNGHNVGIYRRGEEILAIGDGGLQAVFTYVLMRSPGTLSTFLPISVLIPLVGEAFGQRE